MIEKVHCQKNTKDYLFLKGIILAVYLFVGTSILWASNISFSIYSEDYVEIVGDAIIIENNKEIFVDKKIKETKKAPIFKAKITKKLDKAKIPKTVKPKVNYSIRSSPIDRFFQSFYANNCKNSTANQQHYSFINIIFYYSIASIVNRNLAIQSLKETFTSIGFQNKLLTRPPPHIPS